METFLELKSLCSSNRSLPTMKSGLVRKSALHLRVWQLPPRFGSGIQLVGSSERSDGPGRHKLTIRRCSRLRVFVELGGEPSSSVSTSPRPDINQSWEWSWYCRSKHAKCRRRTPSPGHLLESLSLCIHIRAVPTALRGIGTRDTNQFIRLA